jgi:hypothetical protein
VNHEDHHQDEAAEAGDDPYPQQCGGADEVSGFRRHDVACFLNVRLVI